MSEHPWPSGLPSREELCRVLYDANAGRITPDCTDSTQYGALADAVLVRLGAPRRQVRCQWCGNVTTLDDLGSLNAHEDATDDELPTQCMGSGRDDFEAVDAVADS